MTASVGVRDSISRDTTRASLRHYAHRDDLSASEQGALNSVVELVRNRRILDVGVGSGRTVRALRQLSRDYVGVDCVSAKVDQCRARFRFVRFDLADARSMPQYSDGSFDVVMFAMNGLCTVSHADRLSILREVRRVLSPNGVFVFSTFNQAGTENNSQLMPPDFAAISRPAPIAPYRISIEEQRRQLEGAGFNGIARIFDLTGTEVEESTSDESVTFVARPKKVTMDLATVGV
jgi:ubiquinone/menaquinone biosynthesis C-methylase UbiE